MPSWRSSAVLLLVLTFAVSPAIRSADLTASQIVDKSFKAQVFEMPAVTATLNLTNKDAAGQERVQVVRVKALKDKDGQTHSILHFLQPDDVKGTGFLVIAHKQADDEQFLYLPALKKVKRIRADQKGQSFMGTQYSYGDLQSHDVDDHTHRILREEKLAAFDCWVIEATPKRPADEQYGKTIAWIAKNTFVALRMQMFDHKGTMVKVLTTEKVDTVDGKYVVFSSTMQNLVTKKSTRMTVISITTKEKLDASDFTQTRLQTL